MKLVSPVWLLALISCISLIEIGDSETLLPLLPILLKDQQTNCSALEDNEIVLNYRLPNETYPEHYEISVTTNVHLGETSFQGEVAIQIVVASTTSRIVLHARQTEIKGVIIINQATREMEELYHEYELEREFLTLNRNNNKSFETGTKWKLIITFNGQLQDDKGFYLVTDVDENGKEHYTALTHFESSNARHAFPCYDEPAFRANFTITINHSPTYKAISNMPVNKALSRAGKTVFLTTPRIPTYIVGYVISDFDYTEVVSDGITQRVYSRSSKKQEQKFSLVNGMLFFSYLVDYFGITLMLPKLDHVGVTKLNHGGMENWGMFTYKEKNLLYNEKIPETKSKIDAAVTVAHELSHLWFGNYVTIQWWNYLWLKEGLASLFSYKTIANVFPEWNIWQSYHVYDYLKAFDVDEDENPRPLNYDVQNLSEIASIYDQISYKKSSAVWLMWNNALGEKVFQKALQNFFKKNAYNAVTEEEIFTEIENSAKEENLRAPVSISKMISTWTQQGGFPLLTVLRNYNESTFTVKQETFYGNPALKGNKTWCIPINFAVASNSDFSDAKASHYLLNSTEIKISAELPKDDWLILNKRSEYYYRIKYDAKNYNLITKTLIQRPFKIHVRNRAQLLDDASSLCFSKRLDHKILIKMLTYLKTEDQFAPWHIASEIISKYNRFLKFRPDFNHFVRDIVSRIYKKLGVNEISGEHHNKKLIRKTVIGIACDAGLKECVKEVNQKMKAHVMENTTMENNLRYVTFNRGLIEVDDTEFNELYQKLMDSSNEDERYELMRYLGHVQNDRHIKKLIHSPIDMSNKLLPYERYDMLSNIYSKSEKSLLACIEFLNENWDAYGNLQEDFFNPLMEDMSSMAKLVLTKNVEVKYLELLEKVKNSKHVGKRLEMEAKIEIKKNFEWLEKNEKKIMSWISQYLQR